MKVVSNGFLAGYTILWIVMIDSVDYTDLRRQLPPMVSDPNERTFQKGLPTAVNSFNSDCANVNPLYLSFLGPISGIMAID